MAEIKTRDRLLTELKTFLQAYLRSIDTGENSLVKDIVLTPFSVAGKVVMDQIAIARDLHILSRQTGSQLDDEATNYKLERKGGTYASAEVVFYSNTAPTTEVVIPVGAQVATATTAYSTPLTFSVLAETRFAAVDANAYYSYDRDRYEFPVSVLCNTIGTVGNAAANIINRKMTSISGITGVTNLNAATGGLAQEGDDDFRKRIQAAKIGRDLNSVYGLKMYVTSLGFSDSYPIRSESEDVERATGIDVFVVSSATAAVTETFTYDPARTRYSLAYKPLLSVASIVSTTLGTLSASQYTVNIDNTTAYRRSIYANDYFSITPGTALTTGEIITINYTYASQITQGQATFDQSQNDVLTADVILKKAITCYMYLTAALTLKANADAPTTRTQCKNALQQFLSTYRLGDDIQKSDLVVVLQTGYGDYPVDDVDAVSISTYYLVDELGVTYTPVNDVISLGMKNYVVYGNATVT
jgi:uncharacterized phage protein gp47/JayE